MTMKVEFVEAIPRNLEEVTVYVSMTFAIVAHNCFCGCGHQVVTPLSPVNWKLTFDGEEISLYPSIGNWNLECKSHYWIRNGQVIWAERWSDEKIAEGREWELHQKRKFYLDSRISLDSDVKSKNAVATKTRKSWWAKLSSWFST